MLPGFHRIDIAPTRSSRNCIGDSPVPSVVASSETISTGPALTQTRTNCSARFCCARAARKKPPDSLRLCSADTRIVHVRCWARRAPPPPTTEILKARPTPMLNSRVSGSRAMRRPPRCGVIGPSELRGRDSDCSPWPQSDYPS